MGGGSTGNKPVIHSYKFQGVIFKMKQDKKKSSSISMPNTEFGVSVQLLEQKIFERIIEEISLGSQHVEISIKTYMSEKRK